MIAYIRSVFLSYNADANKSHIHV